MKKIIITVITGLVFVSAGYAQTPFLETFFDTRARQDGFTYIYAGRTIMNVKINIPNHVEAMFDDIEYVKILSTEKNTKETERKSFVTSLKGVLRGDGFELILKVQEGDEVIETYLKESKRNNSDIVVLIDSEKKLSAVWVNGKLKSPTKSKEK